MHPFENLLIHCAEDVAPSVIIRGLRAVSDFEYEFQMVGMNRAMNDDIETVFLMADAHYQAIASRLVKEIARLGGDVSGFVPARVARAPRGPPGKRLSPAGVPSGRGRVAHRERGRRSELFALAANGSHEFGDYDPRGWPMRPWQPRPRFAPRHGLPRIAWTSGSQRDAVVR